MGLAYLVYSYVYDLSHFLPSFCKLGSVECMYVLRLCCFYCFAYKRHIHTCSSISCTMCLFSTYLSAYTGTKFQKLCFHLFFPGGETSSSLLSSMFCVFLSSSFLVWPVLLYCAVAFRNIILAIQLFH